jgi:hypothetical protein
MRLRQWVRFSVAALLLGVAAPAHADGVVPSEATPAQREQAQTRFARGKELFAKRSFEEARAEFSASHDIVASPNARLQMGRCLRAMGKFVAAYAEFARTVAEAKELGASDNRYKPASDAAALERGELEPLVGFVSLTISNPTDATRVTVGGEEIRRSAWGDPAPASGPTEVVVETPGHAPVTASVTLAQGGKTSVTIDAQSGALLAEPTSPSAEPPPAPAPEPMSPPPPPPAASPLRTWAYVAGGVGVGGLATFAVFGLLARSTYNDLQNQCGGPCAPDKDKTGEIASGKTQQTVANIGLAVGVLGAGVGATLFVLSRPKTGQAPGVAVVAAPAWIGVQGRL